MTYGQDFNRRDSGRLAKPVVPPEFRDRVAAPGTSAASWQVTGQPAVGGHPGAGRSAGAAYGQQPQGWYGQQPYEQMPYNQAQYGHGGHWAAPRRQSHLVRNVLAGVGGAVTVIIGIAVVAAVNSAGHSVQNTGTSGGSATSASAGVPEKATLGTTITLTGIDSGEQMGVSVTKVISNATPSDSFDAPPTGDRLYAVQFRLTDTGTAAYSDSPSNGATVIDTSGQSYQSGIETVAGCQDFADIENIAPGNSGLGCITFEVPTGAKIVAVQFTLDSGMGPQTGQWDVTG